MIPFSLAQSATKRSSLPMETGSPLIPRIHLPSHWLSCGQTRPQIAGSALDSADDLVMLPRNFPLLPAAMKSGILMAYRTSLYTFCFFTVQAAGSLFHCFFFIITKTYFVKICCSNLRSPALLQVLFFNTSAIICHLRNFRIRRDGYRPHAVSEGLWPSSVLYIACLFMAMIKVDQMTVKLRSVYAGKFHFIAYGQHDRRRTYRYRLP